MGNKGSSNTKTGKGGLPSKTGNKSGKGRDNSPPKPAKTTSAKGERK